MNIRILVVVAVALITKILSKDVLLHDDVRQNVLAFLPADNAAKLVNKGFYSSYEQQKDMKYVTRLLTKMMDEELIPSEKSDLNQHYRNLLHSGNVDLLSRVPDIIKDKIPQDKRVKQSVRSKIEELKSCFAPLTIIEARSFDIIVLYIMDDPKLELELLFYESYKPISPVSVKICWNKFYKSFEKQMEIVTRMIEKMVDKGLTYSEMSELKMRYNCLLRTQKWKAQSRVTGIVNNKIQAGLQSFVFWSGKAPPVPRARSFSEACELYYEGYNTLSSRVRGFTGTEDFPLMPHFTYLRTVWTGSHIPAHVGGEVAQPQWQFIFAAQRVFRQAISFFIRTEQFYELKAFLIELKDKDRLFLLQRQFATDDLPFIPSTSDHLFRIKVPYNWQEWSMIWDALSPLLGEVDRRKLGDDQETFVEQAFRWQHVGNARGMAPRMNEKAENHLLKLYNFHSNQPCQDY